MSKITHGSLASTNPGPPPTPACSIKESDLLPLDDNDSLEREAAYQASKKIQAGDSARHMTSVSPIFFHLHHANFYLRMWLKSVACHLHIPYTQCVRHPNKSQGPNRCLLLPLILNHRGQLPEFHPALSSCQICLWNFTSPMILRRLRMKHPLRL